MQDLFKLPEFKTIAQVFEQAKTVTGVAEAHGMLCGFICAGSRMNGRLWLDTVLSNVEPSETYVKDSRDILINLYDISSRQLKDTEFKFQLLLPSDEDGIVPRIDALGCWCRGYLGGLGLAGVRSQECEDEQVLEVLRDFAEISKVDYDFIDGGQEDELAYSEIVEYVRMGVILIYSELNGQQDSSEEEYGTRLH